MRRPGQRRVPPRLLLWLFCTGLLVAGSLDSHRLFPQYALDGWRRVQPSFPVVAFLLAAWHPLSTLLRRRDVQSHALVCAAALGAAVLGEVAAGAIVLLLFALQEAALAWASRRARRPLERLLRAAPRGATRRLGSEELPVESAELAVGDLYLVRPGERFAADGVVVEGRSEVDESLVLGEGVPSAKGPGDPVFAGSVNQGDTLLVRVGAAAEESLFWRAARRLEQASKEKLPVQQLAERAAQVYTPLVMLLGVAVAAVPPLFLGESLRPWLAKGVLLFLLASPLPLLVAVPAALLPALGGAARRGVYIERPAALDALAAVNDVAFDMTGTLTRGRFEVVETTPFGPFEPRELLALAAGMERGVDHPIAWAIADEARRVGCAPASMDSIRYTPVLGVEASKGHRRYHLGSVRGMRSWGVQIGLAEKYARRLQNEGKEALILAEEGRAIGVIALEDGVREESRRSLRRLRSGGGVDRILLATGSPEGVAARLAHHLELDAHRAELRPEEKAEAIGAWRREGVRLAAVGSGVNDVKAMEAADVGVAIAAAHCRELFEASDIAVASSDLPKLPYLFALARRTRAAIRRNLALAVGGKLAALVLVATGELTLVGAALIDFGLPVIEALSGERLSGRVRLSSRSSRIRP